MMNKKGIEFSFAWLFALIVGAVIIFLAIYATTKLIGTERLATQTEAGKKLGVLLNPVETSVESAKLSSIVFTSQVRLYNTCDKSGVFGSQEISVAEKSGLGSTWAEPGVASSFHNKYLFSEDIIEDKEFILFSKPFYMPFKVADVIFMWPKNKEYCFVQPPTAIRDEIEALNPGNVNVTDDLQFCKRGSKVVCFQASGCDIDVSTDVGGLSGSVKKGYDIVYYEGSLVYGAIFSSKDVYECQVERLMKRTSELSKLYSLKSDYVGAKGCESSSLSVELAMYSNLTQINNSASLREIASMADDLERTNENLKCKLF